MSENSDKNVQIRALGPDDFDVFWPVRLLALRESPEAFGASYEHDKDLPIEQAITRLSPKDGGFVLGAFAPGLVGIVGFARNSGAKVRHKGTIWGVYVVPEYRGRGLAREIMQEALTQCWKIEGLEEVILSVVTDNQVALELYKSLGFESYGLEKRALKISDKYFDEELMFLRFADIEAMARG